MLRIGDRLPETTFDSLDGRTVRLASVLDGAHHLLLVFLRHLG